MSVDKEKYKELLSGFSAKKITLVAVSKTKPVEDIEALYALGQRDFGENYVQELVDKQAALPADIRWHFIGHLQTNKVKYIAPFVHLIHGIDSYKLLKEVNKQGAKNNRKIDCLLQMHIAQEETKFGLDEKELAKIIQAIPGLPQVRVRGLMGMASFTEDKDQVRVEMHSLQKIFTSCQQNGVFGIDPPILSMGMSGDYSIALEEGSTLVRIGSLLFGERNYPAT